MSTTLDEALPEEMEGRSALLEKFTTVEDFVKDYQQREKEYSTSFRYPGDDADEETKKKFNKRIGVPDNYTDYSLPEVKSESGKEMLSQLREVCHSKGMPAATWDAMVGVAASQLNETSEKRSSTRQEKQEQFESLSKKEFGDKHGEVKALSERFTQKVGEKNPEVLEALRNSGVDQSPWWMHLMLEVGKIVGDHNMPTLLTGGMPPVNISDKVAELLKRKAELFAHPSYSDQRHSQYRATRGELDKIYEQIEALKQKVS